MLQIDREHFNAGAKKLLGMFNRNPDADQLDVWWTILKRFELDDVRASMLRWAEEKTHAPTPANIREICSSIAKPSADPIRGQWGAKDLLIACHMYAVSGPQTVARHYDGSLADFARRAIEGYPNLDPEAAGRAFNAERYGAALRNKSISPGYPMMEAA